MTQVPTTRRAAVLGSPVVRSLSPVLHRAAYRALGLTDWRYDAIECREDDLQRFVADAGPEWVGLSLTMPLKRVAVSVAGRVSPLAEAVGAANTLLFDDGSTVADNTDVTGMAAALREAGATTASDPLVLGAGGTAQAALAALRELGARAVTVAVRDVRRTAEVRAAAERLGVALTVVGGLPDEPLPPAGLVVSTLPPGAADALRFARGATPATVLDVVYAPWPTPFARTARDRGAGVASGLSMLLHQAAEQVRLMTGRPAPLDAMRDALGAAVRAAAAHPPPR